MDIDKKETEQPKPNYGVRGYSGCVLVTDDEMKAMGTFRPNYGRIRMNPEAESKRKNSLF